MVIFKIMMPYLNKINRLLGLIENHRMELAVSREDFVRLLKPHVANDGNSGFDIFDSGNIDYKGEAGLSGFHLRRRRTFSKHSQHYFHVFGTFREENNRLSIDLEFRNAHPLAWGFLILVLFFGGSSVAMFLSALFSFDTDRISGGFNMLFSCVVFFSIVGIVIRSVSSNTIRNMKLEMENNFQRYLHQKVS